MKQQFLMVTTNTMIITAITNEATVANGYNKCNSDNGKMKYSVYIYGRYHRQICYVGCACERVISEDEAQLTRFRIPHHSPAMCRKGCQIEASQCHHALEN